MIDLLKDRIKGVLFGQAIGDALGLGTEFMTKEDIMKFYPNSLSDYSQIIQDYHRSRWKKGDWTDDTDMMLCIANSIIQKKHVDLKNIAKKFKEWFNTNPLGIGSNTYKVLSFADYTRYPTKGAELVWELSGRRSAANGGIMRTSVIGLWKENMEEYAADVCRLTHYDPRCIGSCVIVSSLIHSLVYKSQLLSVSQLIKIGERYDNNIREFLIKAEQYSSLDDLALDDAAMGYTLKTMAAALWCLYHCNNFEDGLLSIVNAGGDADTNAAVTCSLLGAKYGYSAIPKRYVDGLVRKDYLAHIVDKITDVFNLNT